MSADWETKSGDCAVCGAHTAKYPLCDACWSECIDAGDEYCGASSAWMVDKVRARCAQICADRAAMLESTADQYPAGTAACFAEEARECERLIRGEGC